MTRIDAMGLSEEYAVTRLRCAISLSGKAYRERYLAWRTGDAQGAKYDLTTAASRPQRMSLSSAKDLPKFRRQGRRKGISSRKKGHWFPIGSYWQ